MRTFMQHILAPSFCLMEGQTSVCLHPSAVPKVAESHAHQLTHLPTLSFVLKAPRLGASFEYALRKRGGEG